MKKEITNNELNDAFKPKTNREARMVEKIKKNEAIYGSQFYSKPERTSLKILLYHIDRIKTGKSIRYDMEEVYLSNKVIIAVCEREGINYKLGMKNNKERVLYIGGE